MPQRCFRTPSARRHRPQRRPEKSFRLQRRSISIARASFSAQPETASCFGERLSIGPGPCPFRPSSMRRRQRRGKSGANCACANFHFMRHFAKQTRCSSLKCFVVPDGNTTPLCLPARTPCRHFRDRFTGHSPRNGPFCSSSLEERLYSMEHFGLFLAFHNLIFNYGNFQMIHYKANL